MKILFVNISDYQIVYKNLSLPLGLLSLATVIKNSNHHESQVIDLNCLYKEEFTVSKVLKENIEQDTKYLLSKEPDAISLYTMCNNYHFALMLAEKIKSENNRIKVLLGGPQATAVAESTLKKYSYVDGIGLGEGENTILGILDGLEKGDLSRARGIAYRDKDNIILRYNDELIQNLDELPMIDLSLYPYKITDEISLDVGRGCPFNCIFCSTKLFWKRKFRIKSAERIYDEIMYYKNNYGITKFDFEHDLFVANRKLVLKLCDMLKKNKTDILWYCSARVDTVDDELLKEMYASGCRGIYFGIESGLEKTQKYIKKNLDIKQIENLPYLLEKNNLRGTLSFIYGFPEETKEDMDKNLMFIYKLIDGHYKIVVEQQLIFQLHKLMFLPKTELTEKYKQELVHKRGYSMEVDASLDKWSDTELNEIIKDVEQFPHYSNIPGSLLEQYHDLDKFFSFVFMTSIFLFDVTYKLLLEEMKGSILKIYEIFQSYAEKEKMDKFYTEFLKNDNEKNEIVIEMLEKVIENYPFTKIDAEAIKDMFAFERDIYLQLYKNKEEKKEINVQKEYQYNVIHMRKNRSSRYVKELTKVLFYTENGKYIMKKVETENNRFSFINLKSQTDLQISL